MKSELSFLLDLVLDEQLPGPLKTRLVTRIREVEKNYATQPQQVVPRGTTKTTPIVSAQAPSMQRIMQENTDLIPKPPVPQTAQAAQALAARQALINGALEGKNEEKRTSPRKF